MTDRLYYRDAYCHDFEATVVTSNFREGTTRVSLDRTAFYPTSGGQQHDTGVLAGHRVIDVLDDDDGVIHVVEGHVDFSVGQQVDGHVEWTRRLDHMQQHTGQHVLSASFVTLAQAETASVHFGQDDCTIDLRCDVAARVIRDVEVAANAIVWEGRLISVRFVDAADIGSAGLRKATTRTGPIRLVEIDGHDVSACGGTHVAKTSQVGAILVTGWERVRSGVRVSFVCGLRALTRMAMWRDTVAASGELLSVLPSGLPSAVEHLLADLRDTRKRLGDVRGELAEARAARLLSQAEHIGPARLVCGVVEGAAADLRLMASLVARAPDVLVGVVSSAPVSVAVARGANLKVACHDVVKDLAGQHGGRGGGKPDLAQAGGFPISADVLTALLRQRLLDALG